MRHYMLIFSSKQIFNMTFAVGFTVHAAFCNNGQSLRADILLICDV